MSTPSLDIADGRAPAMTVEQAMKLRSTIVGVIGFLTLVDLFATQAILPSLARVYDVAPASIGFAVNASTIGMAASCMGVALVSRRLNRRQGIWISLALLAIPTTLLAVAPHLVTFAALRVAQGILMAAAFTLTMTYLAEHCSAEETASALAAYITGVVASNLVGRLVAASVADVFGVGASFLIFAALNLIGALLVLASLDRMSPMASPGAPGSALAGWAAHLRNPALVASFGVGFLILFAFLGVFTYVNFVLAAAPISLSPMSLGLVYFVFLPSMFTTPLAGRVARRVGARTAIWAGLTVAMAGLAFLLQPNLASILAGMVLVGVGTFFAQAIGTGFVGRAARSDRAAASGLYLASYYLGGLTGAAVLGQIFDRLGWTACVAGVALSLVIAGLLSLRLRIEEPRG